MEGNQQAPNNPWALEAYYPQPAAPVRNEELLKTHIRQMEQDNHELKQQMESFKQLAHDKLIAMEGQLEEGRRHWETQFDQLSRRLHHEHQQYTQQLRRDFQVEIDSIRAQLAKSLQEAQQFQEENSTLRSSITQLQNENADLRLSKANVSEEMKVFNDTHRTVLAEQDAKEKEIASLQSTIERLREEHLNLSSLNRTYLGAISDLKSSLEEARAAQTAPPDPQQSSTGSKLDSPDQQSMSDVQSQAGTSVVSDFHSVDFHSPVQAPLMDSYLRDATPQRSIVHVNATGSSKENGYSKIRHPLQPFDGAPGTSSQLWLSQFDKCTLYHGWDDDMQLKEFMMAMTGHADIWWRTLNKEQKAHIKTVRDAFDDHYGGEMTDLMETLHKLDSTHQGNETMITFGPKIQVMLEKVYEGKAHLQIHNFYSHVTQAVADYVSATNPKTLKAAINTAINIERSRKSTGKGKGKAATPAPQFNAAWNPDAKADPMEDVQVNAQQGSFKKFNKKNKNKNKNQGNSNNQQDPPPKPCRLCEKTNHTVDRCFKLNAAFSAYKDTLATSSHVNTQSVALIQGSTPKSINNVEFDPTNNIFYQLHSNAQASVHDPTIPTVVGSDSSNPTSFVVSIAVTSSTQETLTSEALIDTGSMISTISLAEAQRLMLDVLPAPPLYITYGNETQGISDKSAWFQGTVQSLISPGTFLRVVRKQNFPILLGMDWMLRAEVLLDPVRKCVASRQADMPHSNSLMAVEVDPILKDLPVEVASILQLMPNLYNAEERQSYTTAPVEHYIETGNARPVVSRGKRLSPKENLVVDEQVDMLLKKGVIRASKSPWCANPVVVPKPNGDYRFCTNFRGLNQVTIKDKFPLPRMEDLLDKLLGSQWYHCIDLNSAYFQIPIFEEHKCKTAFRSSTGLWEYNSLAQGLCNSPATFARYMENILSSVSEYTIKYLDDILCYADTREASLEQLKQVLYILNYWNLKINLKKCQFLQQEVKFLGFIITGSGVKSNPDKVLPIKTWTTPTTTQELMQFLGICTFYHKFVRNLADTAAPLYHLLKKDTPFVWTTKCDNAFQRLKAALIQLPELAFPDGNLPYDLHCDASNVALGSVLVQAGRPVAYASRTLTPAERNYSTTERECLSVAWSLQYFHCYIHGATLVIYTDHAALKALLGTKDPKGRIARWILDIWMYEFTLLHRKGKDNADADALSRLELQHNITHIASQTALTMDELIKAQQTDTEISKILNSGNIQYPYMLKEGILCYIKFNPPVIVVPKVWRSAFLQRIHRDPTSGHLGRDKTLARAKDNGYWTEMNNDVKQFVASCIDCQKFKTKTHKYKNLQSIEVGAAGDRWAADIAYLPETNGGHKYLLVMMEYLTKWVITVPLVSATADAIANAVMFEIILKFGTPKEFLTDNGANFISETIHIICTRLNIAKIQTSVEAPSTDGLVERMNRTIKSSLSIYCQEDPTIWDQYLPLVTFAINTAKQASTEVSPFEAMYGRKPNLPSLHDLPTVSFKTYSAQAWSSYLAHYIPILHAKIRQNIEKHQQQQHHYFNKNRKAKEDFKEGDVVLKVKLKDNWKFGEAKLAGPFKIIKINKRKNACTLEDISNKEGKRKRKNAATTTANFRDIYRMK